MDSFHSPCSLFGIGQLSPPILHLTVLQEAVVLLPSRTDLFSATDLCFKTSSPSPEVTERIGRVPLYSFSLSLSAFRTHPPVSVSCTVFPRDSFQCSLDAWMSSFHFPPPPHQGVLSNPESRTNLFLCLLQGTVIFVGFFLKLPIWLRLSAFH
jgi:hypothetical protein